MFSVAAQHTNLSITNCFCDYKKNNALGLIENDNEILLSCWKSSRDKRILPEGSERPMLPAYVAEPVTEVVLDDSSSWSTMMLRVVLVLHFHCGFSCFS